MEKRCRIKKESTLHLALRLRGEMQILVKTLTGGTVTLALWGASAKSGRLFFGSPLWRSGESTPGVIKEDADGSRSHVSGRQKYHRGATAPRAAGIHGHVFVACQNDGDDPNSTAERDHDLKLD